MNMSTINWELKGNINKKKKKASKEGENRDCRRKEINWYYLNIKS